MEGSTCIICVRIEGTDHQCTLELSEDLDGLEALRVRVAQLFSTQTEAVQAIGWVDEITTDREVRRLSHGSRLACRLSGWQRPGASPERSRPPERSERRVLVRCAQQERRELVLGADVTQVAHLKAAAAALFAMEDGAEVSVFWDDEEGDEELRGDREVRQLADGAKLMVRVHADAACDDQLAAVAEDEVAAAEEPVAAEDKAAAGEDKAAAAEDKAAAAEEAAAPEDKAAAAAEEAAALLSTPESKGVVAAEAGAPVETPRAKVEGSQAEGAEGAEGAGAGGSGTEGAGAESVGTEGAEGAEGTDAEDGKSNFTERLLTVASSSALPSWWPAEPELSNVAACSLAEALQTLLGAACEEQCGVRLQPQLLDGLLSWPDEKQPSTQQEFNQILAKGNKPWATAQQAIGSGANIAAVAAKVAATMFAAGGTSWLQCCQVRTEQSKKGSSHFMQVEVTELAWAHELRRLCWAERVHTVHLDSLERANCELLLKGLQQSMDSGVLGPFRQLVERAMRHLQKECPVLPDARDRQYRKWVEKHFCGEKKSGSKKSGEKKSGSKKSGSKESGEKKSACFWENLESDECIKRLVFAEPHEYTTALFINFKNFAGRPISFMDWSALCACCESCDIFKMTVREAAALGLCTPCLDGCDQKEKESIRKMTLQEVARAVRGVRNPMQHYNILDMEFPAKFATVHKATRALGGDVALVTKLTEANATLFPAKNTLEEVQRYEQAMERGTAKVVTGDQCEALCWLRDQPDGCVWKLQAGPGTGKSLLLTKHSACYLKAAKYLRSSQSNPVLLLAHSYLLRAELVRNLRREIGVPAQAAPGEAVTDGPSVLQFPGCSAAVVVSAVDELWDFVAESPMLPFSTVLVDEAHHVFSHQPLHHLQGQHVHRDPADVWPALQRLCAPDCRYFLLHDESYQRVGHAAWPDGCQERNDFLSVVVRMPGAVRDVAMPFCRDLQRHGDDGKVHFYKLLDERVKGPDPLSYQVEGTTLSSMDGYTSKFLLELNFLEAETKEFNWKYGEQLAECLQRLLVRDELDPGQIAVLMPGSSERMIQGLLAATLERCSHQPSKAALSLTCGDRVRADCLYWGSVESFAGLERPAVVVTGFHHPLHLVHTHQQKTLSPSELHADSRVDPLVYLAATRSTYLLAVVDTNLDDFVAHYDIRNEEHGLVPHSSGNHSASMGGDCLVLEYTLDFGEPLPPKGQLATLAMIATHDLTPRTWALRVRQGFEWGHCADRLKKLVVWMGDQRSDQSALLARMHLNVLTNLQTLELSQNQLTEVPKELGNLQALHELWLDQNQLTEVPKELGNLQALQQLRLEQNQLTEVHKELGNLADQVMDVTDLLITAIRDKGSRATQHKLHRAWAQKKKARAPVQLSAAEAEATERKAEAAERAAEAAAAALLAELELESTSNASGKSKGKSKGTKKKKKR